MLHGKRILLIVSGGIAAYKAWSWSAACASVAQRCAAC